MGVTSTIWVCTTVFSITCAVGGAAGALVGTAAPPHAVRIIEAMISRDGMYKSFFMVRFLLKLDFLELTPREMECR
jgi:hypothetical protein